MKGHREVGVGTGMNAAAVGRRPGRVGGRRDGGEREARVTGETERKRASETEQGSGDVMKGTRSSVHRGVAVRRKVLADEEGR
jgi:hypothetical protein